MEQNPQDTNYVIEQDTSSQGASHVTDETAAQEVHEQAVRDEEARQATAQEAARKRVEDAINSGMADMG